VFLDGDALRAAIADDLGHGREDRRRAAMRHGRTCKLLAEQGIPVVCSTISLFHEVQRWNRANIPGYREIYLRVPLPELERRDPKGLYARARRGETKNVVGIDVQPEEPENPDLVIDNYGDISTAQTVDLIWQHLTQTPVSQPPTGTLDAAAGDTGFFGTKAETLEKLAGRLRHASVLPQVRFTVAEWRRDPAAVTSRIARLPWGPGALIARSSARSEDGASESQAGKFLSVPNIAGAAMLSPAVERVIASFGATPGADDQIFIQPMLRDVALAGVAFTRDPNSSGPYIVINYDETSGRTDAVTSGAGSDLKTFYCTRHRRIGVPARLAQVVHLLDELEVLTGLDSLDVEFAVGSEGIVYLLQVRPLVTIAGNKVPPGEHSVAVADIARKIELMRRPHPYLHGNRTVFGVMPDWNPAEIVGLRPRPLALSLYRDLVTDSIWAYQRDNYGYKNLRSFPLLVSFHGLPYVDVRVSFNSFVPRDIEGDLAERLVNHYIDRLLVRPSLHDKVEFEIIFSCYTLDLPERLKVLRKRGFSEADLEQLSDSLRRLTNRIIHSETGLWRHDREKIDRLVERLPPMREAPVDKISRIYWLLEDCKRYGTLPFAGLARAGFIAVQLLRSLVSTGVLDEAEYSAFMANLDTVGSRIGRDLARLPKEEFLGCYGHLRPGTYDILSPRYDEEPDRYFDWSASKGQHEPPPRFALSVEQLRRIERLLKEHRLDHDVLGFMEFIKAGIEGREYAKFVFTRSLSDALSLVRRLGEEHGLSLEDCAYLDIGVIQSLYGESDSVALRLRDSVTEGRRRHELTRSLVLPPLVTQPEDVWAFHLPAAQPNYVTQKTVTGSVVTAESPVESLAGAILFIPSADPGFDWIFTRGVAGFVTQFGGVNSHMAIRAGELGVPAVIGAGEALYRSWQGARRVSLDCANRQVQALS
jgi:glutamine kinase